jgi:hypothetical protein
VGAQNNWRSPEKRQDCVWESGGNVEANERSFSGSEVMKILRGMEGDTEVEYDARQHRCVDRHS